jgi:TRAP transporter TAXI family solute receptor
MKRFFILLGILTIFCFTLSGVAEARMQFVTIGTGGVTGVYYPTGGAISRIVNKKSKIYHLKVTVESTAGSVYNINAVCSGDLEFGIAQSDRQYQAWYGLKEWQGKPQKKLRSVFSIHPETVTLIATDKSNIHSLKDLKGKRVAIGNPGSGQLGNSRDALWLAGLNEKKDIKAFYIKAVEAAEALQDERIDAYFYTVGHPNGSIKEATAGRIKVHIVPIPNVEPLLKKFPYYAKAFIPKKFYPNLSNKEDLIPSFGVKATFVTSKDVPENVVYAITKEVFDNFEAFKKLHPAYSVLTKEKMLQGLTAPLHPGAIKYYKESGLIKYVNPELIK